MTRSHETTSSENPDDGLPIADAAVLLGIPMPTLRSWETRYGIPPVHRSPGRHRRYSEGELDALRMMRDHIASGERAGTAAQAVRSLLGLTGPATAFVQALLDATERSDVAAVREELDRAASVLGLGGCLDDVLFPTMHQIGIWWQTGRCEIHHERFTTEAARVWLDTRMALAPAPDTRLRSLVLAGGPTDRHTIGLEGLALLLRYRHRACRMLGARTSTVALTTAIQATGAGGVVVVCHLLGNRRQALVSMAAAAELGVEVFYAGNAFATERSRADVPGRYLGVRLAGASAEIDAVLS